MMDGREEGDGPMKSRDSSASYRRNRVSVLFPDLGDFGLHGVLLGIFLSPIPRSPHP